MIHHKTKELRSNMVNSVEEEVEGTQTLECVDDKIKNKSSGPMGPPLFPPKRIEPNNDGRDISSPSSIDSSDNSSDSFDFQPPLPNGQYSFATARFRAQYGKNIFVSEFQSGSFTKSPLFENTKRSKALTKGIQLFPVEVYNNNVGSSKMRELQMPTFEDLKSSKSAPKAICDRNMATKQHVLVQHPHDPQTRRHKALKSWWDRKTSRQSSNEEIFTPPLSSIDCIAPSDIMKHKIDDDIREGYVPYSYNEYFATPHDQIAQNKIQSAKQLLEKEEEQKRSRLIWEAVQDGLVSLETILALPIDWGDICLEHYQANGIISTLNSSNCDKVRGKVASIYTLENPLTSKAKQLKAEEHKLGINIRKENDYTSSTLLFQYST